MEPIYGIPPDLIRGPEAEALPLAGEVNWGMEKFGVALLREQPFEPIKVAVVDTGIDDTHPMLEPVFKGGEGLHRFEPRLPRRKRTWDALLGDCRWN